MTVPRDGHTLTSIYYYPGFHKATLLVGDSVVHAHPIAINTDGWLALARRGLDDLVPVYLDAPNLGRGGVLAVSPERLAAHRIDLAESHFVSYYRVQDFGPVRADDFRLSARLSNPLSQGGLTGQYAEVIVMAESGRHIVPLSIPGCVANLRVPLRRERTARIQHRPLGLWLRPGPLAGRGHPGSRPARHGTAGRESHF